MYATTATERIWCARLNTSSTEATHGNHAITTIVKLSWRFEIICLFDKVMKKILARVKKKTGTKTITKIKHEL